MIDMEQVAIVLFYFLGIGTGVQIPFIVKKLRTPDYIPSKEDRKE